MLKLTRVGEMLSISGNKMEVTPSGKPMRKGLYIHRGRKVVIQ